MSRDHDPTTRSDALVHSTNIASKSSNLSPVDEAQARPAAGADFGDVALSGAEPLQDGGAAAAAGCGETITWVPQSPVPIDIRADTAVEFANGIDQVIGAGGHTHVDIDLNPSEDKGRMTAVGLTVTSKIIRPRWAGGRPTDAERELIKRVETFIKEHEERHRDLSRSVMQKAVCDALNQPLATAKAVIKRAVCDLEPTAQEALDAKEGQLEWVKSSSGAVIDFKAVGAKHNYHEKGCDPWKPPPPNKDAPKEGEK